MAKAAKKIEEGGPRSSFGMGVLHSCYPSNKPNYDSLILGSSLVSKGKKEADSGSTHVAPLRAKESASPIQIRSRFNEAKASQSSKVGSRYRVVLIQEGLGNLNDCFFYTKECLQESASSGLFEGIKCYADHPSSVEEEILPERSTRDILGHFEDVQFEEGEGGRGMLTADLCTVEDPSFDWARALMMNSVQYAQKHLNSEFVGLSINANGEASEVPIQEFLRDAKLPASVLEKVERAASQGISEIRPVSSLREATSCDLVTEAGAGGKILKMIEQERNPKMAKKKVKESEGKEMEKKSKEAENEDAGHDDEAQDKELIQKMIKQYLGDDHADSEEAQEMAKEAMEAYGSDTKDKQEAYEKAGTHLKMAMKMGDNMKKKKEAKEAAEKNESESESESQESESESESESKEADDKPSKDDEDEDKKESESHKESRGKNLRTELLKEKAESAKLRESLKKYEMTDYLEKKLKESKMPVSVTKKFREAVGTPKSKGEIDQAFKLFKAVFEESSSAGDDFSAFMIPEKTNNHFEESDDKGEKTSFDDCVE